MGQGKGTLRQDARGRVDVVGPMLSASRTSA